MSFNSSSFCGIECEIEASEKSFTKLEKYALDGLFTGTQKAVDKFRNYCKKEFGGAIRSVFLGDNYLFANIVNSERETATVRVVDMANVRSYERFLGARPKHNMISVTDEPEPSNEPHPSARSPEALRGLVEYLRAYRKKDDVGGAEALEEVAARQRKSVSFRARMEIYRAIKEKMRRMKSAIDSGAVVNEDRENAITEHIATSDAQEYFLFHILD